MPYFHKSSSHAEFPPECHFTPWLRAEISSWSLPRFFNVSVYYGCWKILLFLFRSNILSFFPTIYAKPEWAPFFLPLASREGGSDSGREEEEERGKVSSPKKFSPYFIPASSPPFSPPSLFPKRTQFCPGGGGRDSPISFNFAIVLRYFFFPAFSPHVISFYQ